ncbi:hypothetical protein Plhal304r1_c005g0022621 [Plasmopara halstedii]
MRLISNHLGFLLDRKHNLWVVEKVLRELPEASIVQLFTRPDAYAVSEAVAIVLL